MAVTMVVAITRITFFRIVLSSIWVRPSYALAVTCYHGKIPTKGQRKKSGTKTLFARQTQPLFTPHCGENLAAVATNLDDSAVACRTVIVFISKFQGPLAVRAKESAPPATPIPPGVTNHTTAAARAPLKNVRFLPAPSAAATVPAAIDYLPVVALLALSAAALTKAPVPGVLGVPHLATARASTPLPLVSDQAMQMQRLEVVATWFKRGQRIH